HLGDDLLPSRSREPTGVRVAEQRVGTLRFHRAVDRHPAGCVRNVGDRAGHVTLQEMTGPSRVISLLLVSAPEIYLSLVVPVRNGADRLAVHLEALRAFVCAQARPAELILVDDCSESAAAQLLAEFGRDAAETGERVTLLRNQENRGKGFSVARGIRAARGR